MKNTILHRGFFSRLAWGVSLVGLLFVTAPLCAQDIQVDSADPSSAEQGTYDLEVTVSGDGFAPDSEVDFFVAGTGDPGEPPGDPGGITVKNVKRRGPKSLKVTIDVASDAVTDDFDIVVRSRGRTGKGTELFRVLAKTKSVWAVEIPDAGDFNMVGNQPLYLDAEADDGVRVDVSKQGTKGGTTTHFFFLIEKCVPGQACYLHSPAPITLRNITWDPSMVLPDPDGNPPCVFPGECGLIGDLSDCLMCFVNGEHPYWGAGQTQDDADYRYFYFEVRVQGDLSNIVGTVRSSGDLTFETWNTRDILIEGDEDDHALYSHVDLPGDEERGYIEVTRVSDNSWEVVVRVIDVYPRMNFVENYVGCFKPPNKKGNCPWEYKHSIWAWTSGPLTFQATWSKVMP